MKVDDSKREVEACTRMTSRCKGDTCATCKVCGQFVRGIDLEHSLNLARRRASPSRPARRQVLVNQGRLS